MAVAEIVDPVEHLLYDGTASNHTRSLDVLRKAVVENGMKQEDGICPYRLYAWLVLLQTRPVDYERYSALLERGASSAYAKIQDDVHRTLATDPTFTKRVTKSSLTRLLNTVAWTTHDKLAEETPLPPSPTISPTLEPQDEKLTEINNVMTRSPSTAEVRKPDLYVQGMNVIAAPLLFVARSEPAAFSLMSTILQNQIPTYFAPGLAGVHVAMDLVQEVLNLAEPELVSHLPPANTYAMGPLMTMCASVPPLSEVLCLWDFLFAAGPHLIVLCVAAFVISMKEQLLATDRPSMLLGRIQGPLDAHTVIQIVRHQLAPKVFQNPDLGQRIISHTRIPSPGLQL